MRVLVPRVSLFFATAAFFDGLMVLAGRLHVDGIGKGFNGGMFTFKNIGVHDNETFSHIRELYGVDLQRILNSFHESCGPAQDFGGAGKSGACFLASDDGQFILKSMEKEDWKSLLRILDDYYRYLARYPDTLLPRYLSMFQDDHGKGYVLMYNWLRPLLHKQSPKLDFDLKGTIEDRLVMQKRDVPLTMLSTGKDINFQSYEIFLPPEKRAKILQIIERDTRMLAHWKLMDYSLILRMEAIGECDLSALATLCTSKPGGSQLTRGEFAEHNGYVVGVRDNVIYVYSFGIIDVLQRWNAKKKVAEQFKAAKGWSEDERDTVQYSKYQTRFLNYFRVKFQPGAASKYVRDLSSECNQYSMGDRHSQLCVLRGLKGEVGAGESAAWRSHRNLLLIAGALLLPLCVQPGPCKQNGL